MYNKKIFVIIINLWLGLPFGKRESMSLISKYRSTTVQMATKKTEQDIQENIDIQA